MTPLKSSLLFNISAVTIAAPEGACEKCDGLDAWKPHVERFFAQKWRAADAERLANLTGGVHAGGFEQVGL